ncbi:MAG: biotin--[acetyl-CoA-carboxylase] ligase [Atopobiaceae bacterium]
MPASWDALVEGRAGACERMPRTCAACDDVVLLPSCGSTNDEARALFGVPSAGPLLLGMVAADAQTRGRGRLGRSWVSGQATSLTASFVVAVPQELLRDGRAGWLTLAAGLATADALRSCVPADSQAARTLAVKWPNDVYCSGRKISGVLSEVAGAAGGLVAVVVGIGANLLVPAGQLPTPNSTSLQLHADGLPAFDQLRDGVCAGICEGLTRWVGALATNDEGRLRQMRERLADCDWTRGRHVVCRLAAGQVVEGTAGGALDDGSLPVTTADGRVVVVTSGDVGVCPTRPADGM